MRQTARHAATPAPPSKEQIATGGPRYRFPVGEKTVVVRPLTWAQLERAEDAVVDVVQTLARHPDFDFANPLGMAGVMAGLGIRVIGKLLRQLYGLQDEDLEELDLVLGAEIVRCQLEVSQLPELQKKGAQIVDLWRKLKAAMPAGPGSSSSSSPNLAGPETTSGSAPVPENASSG